MFGVVELAADDSLKPVAAPPVATVAVPAEAIAAVPVPKAKATRRGGRGAKARDAHAPSAPVVKPATEPKATKKVVPKRKKASAKISKPPAA